VQLALWREVIDDHTEQDAGAALVTTHLDHITRDAGGEHAGQSPVDVDQILHASHRVLPGEAQNDVVVHETSWRTAVSEGRLHCGSE
jgi:hypothetical protein